MELRHWEKKSSMEALNPVKNPDFCFFRMLTCRI
jgi:hypothetical protein